MDLLSAISEMTKETNIGKFKVQILPESGSLSKDMEVTRPTLIT
jgi:hypothetical protein